MATVGVGGGVWHRQGSHQDLRPLCRRKPAEAADPRSVTEDVPWSFSIIPKTCPEKDGQGLACPPESQGKRRGRGAAGLTQRRCPPTSAKGAHMCLCIHTHTLALHPGHQIAPQQLQENSMELAHR